MLLKNPEHLIGQMICMLFGYTHMLLFLFMLFFIFTGVITMTVIRALIVDIYFISSDRQL